ncbi:MAG: transposase, partial [Ktedonobacteraceae bacterium]
MLPDRESATVEKWLAEHPEVEIVSRDRGKEFMKAATQAAPQAQQVADRFHLLHNLTEVLQVVLARCRTEVRQSDGEPLTGETQAQKPPLPLPTPETWQQSTDPRVAKAHQARQSSRDDRYQQMKA